MNVLTITGDKTFTDENPRFDLQAQQVRKLVPVYWGRGSLWPSIPKDRFDIITSQDPFWRGLFALFVARKMKTRLNVQVHTDLFVHKGIRRAVASFVLRKADSVRVVSEKIKRQVEEINKVAHITVLPVFIDATSFRNIQRKGHPNKTILWIGRFEDEKDPNLAINVFKKIIQQGITAKLIMLGAGSLEKTLKKNAEELKVEFPGWQDPKKYFETADVVLSTSKHESFGVSIVEALLAGVPVVALPVGVAQEAGAIVVPREKLTVAVIDVLQSGTRGELKLKSIEDKYEWAKLWRQSL